MHWTWSNNKNTNKTEATKIKFVRSIKWCAEINNIKSEDIGNELNIFSINNK
jgi:hypothetical protein